MDLTADVILVPFIVFIDHPQHLNISFQSEIGAVKFGLKILKPQLLELNIMAPI